MDPQEPRIIELDPDKAPRTTAFILLACGLMGVGFLLINLVFTGEDPYQTRNWGEDDDVSIQGQYNITPNVWRGKGSDDEEDEVEEQIVANKRLAAAKKPTTNRFNVPGLEQLLNRPGLPTLPQPPGMPNPTVTPGTPTPGATPNPLGGTSGTGSSATPQKP
ncbi:MAG TPA: hypothetical protein VH475_01720 [Tepidisphaeraceae bacterium]|jgi:hypothetical protein